MPHFIRGRKVKSAKKGKERKGTYVRQLTIGRLTYDLNKWIRIFSYAAVFVMAVLTIVVFILFNFSKSYPGRVKSDTLNSMDKGSDYIVLSWEGVQNADMYKVWVKERDVKSERRGDPEEDQADYAKAAEIDDSWLEYDTKEPKVKVDGLKDGTSYSFVVRADSVKREGSPTRIRNFRTKKIQTIDVEKTVTKFTFSKPFELEADAETDLVFESEDPDVAVVDPETNKIKITGDGETEIKVRAKSSSTYEAAKEVVDLKVIESEAVPAGGASAHNIYHLDSDNCDVVKMVTGAEGAVVPQGLAYTGDKYIIAYGMGSPNRMISFDVDGDGKEVSAPTVSIGHPNGFAYADENGLCYCAKGWTSKVFTYEPASGEYGSVNLSYGCSGIAYDRKEKLLYTCSRTAMVAYDISDGYSIKYRCGVVSHSGNTFTQDCGGHAGIMLRCLSGSSKHGINYIDLYDMKNGNYLGTLTCDLSEVESCIVDEDGFLEILANNSSGTDYIWKTDLNIDTLGEGL